MTSVYTTTVSVMVLLFSAVGCSDPAANVHQAEAKTVSQQSDATKPSESRNYVIRPESTIGFVGSKVTGSHDGGFKQFSGNIPVAGGQVMAPAEIKIDMNSIWSDNERLTGHLKSADFFEVEKYPYATFTVTSIKPGADGRPLVEGNLDLHGVVKSISFPAEIGVSEEAVTVQAEFAINRKDFNINYPGRPNDLIRDQVVIRLNLRATPEPTA